MATVAAVASPPEAKVTLRGVSWQTYESLLADFVDRSVPRFTYDRGVLEIVSPSTLHEKVNRSLAQLVEVTAEELGIDVLNVGSMTFKRQDLQRGFEPDSSFYIQHEATVGDKDQIDLAVDPPPDLIIEIEVSRSAIARLPIYAELGIPEVWRFDGERVAILRLADGAYREATASLALPPLTGEVLTRFVAASQTLKRTAWLREVRLWVRDHGAAGAGSG